MKLLKNLFLLFFVLLTNVILSAPPPPPAGSPGCWPPPCIPVDGGIGFLIAAGAAYGVKKLYNTRQKKQTI